MKTFKLTATVTISINTEVEAETLEKAIEIAQERSIKSYEWGDKGQYKHNWISDEYDGIPTDIQES